MAASSQLGNKAGRGKPVAFVLQAGFAISMVALTGVAGSAVAQTAPLAVQPGQAHGFMQPTSASGEPGRGALQRAASSSVDAAFNRADRDRDGRLSRLEVEHFPALALNFEQIDRNRDSFISREEFNSAVAD